MSEAKKPLPFFERAPDEDVYFRVAGIFCLLNAMINQEEEVLAIDPQERSGIRILCHDVLGEVELMVYGEKPWTTPKI